MRLNTTFRMCVYFGFAVLFATGMILAASDLHKDVVDNDPVGFLKGYLAFLKDHVEFAKDHLAALKVWMLAIHGGVAMFMLMAIGALVQTHAVRSWNARMNRVTGSLAASCNAILILSALVLYYNFGSDLARLWASDIHLVFGIAIPLLLFVHIWWGRRARYRRDARRAVARPAA